jgi:putative tricarboxylic transport membrane protein
LEALTSLIHGFGVLADPMNIVYMFVGIFLGVLIGVLPGLGGANGVAILLPLTFSMSPTSAIIMLSSIYWGALFGGAITSILFNIPASPGRWRRPSTATRWRRRARPARRSRRPSPGSFIGAFIGDAASLPSGPRDRAFRAALRARRSSLPSIS